MSKKTNAEKQKARQRHKPRRNKRRLNPAFGKGIVSDASMIDGIELMAFGTLGCALLRALKIKPIELLAVPSAEDEPTSETIQ